MAADDPRGAARVLEEHACAEAAAEKEEVIHIVSQKIRSLAYSLRRHPGDERTWIAFARKRIGALFDDERQRAIEECCGALCRDCKLGPPYRDQRTSPPWQDVWWGHGLDGDRAATRCGAEKIREHFYQEEQKYRQEKERYAKLDAERLQKLTADEPLPDSLLRKHRRGV